jgi:hypothetical protein
MSIKYRTSRSLLPRGSILSHARTSDLLKHEIYSNNELAKQHLIGLSGDFSESEINMLQRVYKKIYNGVKMKYTIKPMVLRILLHSSSALKDDAMVQEASVYTTINHFLKTDTSKACRKERLRHFYNIIVPERNDIYVNISNSGKIISRLKLFGMKPSVSTASNVKSLKSFIAKNFNMGNNEFKKIIVKRRLKSMVQNNIIRRTTKRHTQILDVKSKSSSKSMSK